jgi:glycosyltransferase involved in cell wall biosynthesis
MNKKPLVSIIIPFVNDEKFFKEAIESVLTQTYDNWELLLVDDGSTDSSTQTALSYAKQYPERIYYLQHEGHQNKGIPASRNLGIRNARGDYISFLDSDDLWLPHKLDRQIAILGLQPRASMVYGSSQYWYSWTGNPEDKEHDYVPDLGVQEDTLFEPPDLLLLLHPLGYGSSPPPSDLLLRRELVERIGGFEEDFRGDFQFYSDMPFLAKVYINAGVFVSSECWDRYRIRPDSSFSVSTKQGHYHAARQFFLNWLETYLSKKGVNNAEVWAALHKAVQPYGHSILTDRLQELYTRETKWWLRMARGSEANLVFPPDEKEMVRITISKARKKNSFDIQLNQPHLKVLSNHTYTINFRARADRPRTIFVGFAQAHEPWAGLGLYKKFELTAEWQSFQEDFVATASDDNARIHFDLGESDISVELTSVTLRSLPDGKTIEPDYTFLQYYAGDRWKHEQTKSDPATGIMLSGEGALGLNPMETPSSAGKVATPRFSVVIPTYQRRDLVLAAVRSFERQEFDGSFEVIVVVDGSNDGTTEALRGMAVSFPLTVVEQENKGLAAARNRGAEAAHGEILLFLDDDMEAHPRFLAEHDLSQREGADIVFGHFPLHPESPANFISDGIKLWSEERRRRLSAPGASLTLYDLAGGQMSISRKTFQSTGGFDTDFIRGGTFGFEDIDLCYRLLQKGCRAVFNPFAISYHKYIVGLRQFLRRGRKDGHADALFVKTHPEQAKTVLALRGSEERLNRWLWRPMATLSPLTTPLMTVLRWLALKLAERGTQNTQVVKFFYQVHKMEYWRGVHEAGGIPRKE